ncbi:MAG: hypothetical protein AB7T49_18335 [Oligoflexales bacterium]
MRTNKLKFFTLAISLLWVKACGNGKGGDHIPDLKTYSISSLPEGAFSKAAQSEEFSGDDVLRRFAFFTDKYDICVSSDQFSEDFILEVNTRLQWTDADLNKSGLETAINHALKNVRKYSSKASNFSKRIELALVHDYSDGCEAVLLSAKTSEFPFKDGELSPKELGIFYPGQLKTSGGKVNTVPVMYINEVYSEHQQPSEFAIGAFLGLRPSDLDASMLNPGAVWSDTAHSYFLKSKDADLVINDDTVTIYGFALAFYDELEPEDLESYHHYADQLRPSSDYPRDDDLAFPSGIQNIAFTEAVGDAMITGSRTLADSISVCFDKGSAAIEDDWLTEYLQFANSATESTDHDSLFYELHERDAAFNPVANIATSDCNLYVVFRSQEQFPFTEYPNNGLYVGEGKVKDKDDQLSQIPVIYLNISNLELDPEQNTDAKYVGDVFQHEFAHFIGLKHSDSSTSILSPAGYNNTWDVSGSDDQMFNAWLNHWSKN